MAPIDPMQLLNALGNLLSNAGGIKSVENVHKIASLMKKFSKKLVSRCIYCSVLKVTARDVLNVFLDQDGWVTINLWLTDAKETENTPFLIEMLELCRVLPMTVDRLKENNTAKVAKGLCKSSDDTVKKLAVEVVTKWMKIIKGEHIATCVEKPVEKVRKKKRKVVKDTKSEKETNHVKNNHVAEETKTEVANESDDEDTDDKEAELAESISKIKEPRPKTVKRFQTKFRSTGLIEETPLPKAVVKKTVVIDRTAVAAAKNAVKRSNTSLPSFPEKKIKPSSLITPADQANTGPGIKLIPPKPKPVHILHESAGFMDALVAAPPVPVRKRRKSQSKGGTPTSPTTPPATAPPKLQFYKDTLEMNENESAENSQESEESQRKESSEGGDTESIETSQEKDGEDDEKMDTSNDGESGVEGENKLRSILSVVKKKDKKKSVNWAEESNLKEFFYFELDETERVNVNNVRNFGDMKSLEMKREREVFESTKRMMKGDKMAESTMWSRLLRIDIPPPIVEPGCNSTERELQMLHQKTTLQEIYFSREMIPDTPHEPEPEQHNPQEPQIIPLEDMSNPGQIVDYSSMDLPSPKASLPPILTNLMMTITGQTGFASPLDDMQQDMMHQPNEIPMQMQMDHPSMGILGAMPDHYDMSHQEQFMGPPPNAEWRGPDGKGPPLINNFFPQDMNMHQRMGMPHGGPRHPMQGGMPRGPPSMGMHIRGHNMGPMRGRVPRTPCRHFMMGGCRYGANCNFLHPGVNGPVL